MQPAWHLFQFSSPCRLPDHSTTRQQNACIVFCSAQCYASAPAGMACCWWSLLRVCPRWTDSFTCCRASFTQRTTARCAPPHNHRRSSCQLCVGLCMQKSRRPCWCMICRAPASLPCRAPSTTAVPLTQWRFSLRFGTQVLPLNPSTLKQRLLQAVQRRTDKPGPRRRRLIWLQRRTADVLFCLFAAAAGN